MCGEGFPGAHFWHFALCAATVQQPGGWNAKENFLKLWLPRAKPFMMLQDKLLRLKSSQASLPPVAAQACYRHRCDHSGKTD